MRPKVTFLDGGKVRRQPQYLAWWDGEYASKADEGLPDELRRILTEERGNRAPKKTAGQDIRHTLRALRKLEGEELRRAVRVMDGWTQAYLVTGALLWHRRRIGPDCELPEHWANIKRNSDQEIMEMIVLALKSLPITGGRRPHIHGDLIFARRLAGYWQRAHGRRPTVTVGADCRSCSPFVLFAIDCFERIGRGVLSPARIAPLLRKAVKPPL